MPRRLPRRLTLLTAAVTALALTAGCGAEVRQPERAASADGYPVTIDNCGQKVTYDRAPSRVVAYDIGIIETMFALGLRDRLAGYVLGKDHDPADSPWKEDFAKAHRLGADRPSKELVLEAKADFVYAGWNYGFREGSGLTPQDLEQVGVRSYVLTESCRNGVSERSRGIVPPLEALYTDLRNLGKIFGVSDKAEELVRRYQEQVASVEASTPKDRPRPKVFVYDSGTDKPFTTGRFAAAHEIITRAGGDHVFTDLRDSWVQVGWESVVQANPDIIIINDYGGQTPAEKQAFLESYPPLANVNAVKNKRFFTLPYAALVEGPRNPAAIGSFAEYLRGLPG
ncbi:iron complex transport system substrate-binding protein [Streptoalloteichus tenebrarius]|uniref:Iron complex transport system substrate-binding protein n=1 Tax=Streptoalloteichus tenebrarius (strain ATCC 17920 / DSM 40477 / JCM 4838 / CBS 697.72 / NBRC 16177 / NCIMB 11028 / NRRL B-12390 / A12253. 1 / ISP 5477) TaxID=1933 RepID=A0ABT1HQR6_STRSD|nr:ABC transporter substrate-binding protein [Streptoalloteichus tenebrarius]MCP2257842.1 iron complex transport system substrate-binding protein [Streptoalloteichus tenebrarius]BFE99796.1 ABC transporter substrate-binding protein [Streptoalloteichus tenebrarius]